MDKLKGKFQENQIQFECTGRVEEHEKGAGESKSVKENGFM